MNHKKANNYIIVSWKKNIIRKLILKQIFPSEFISSIKLSSKGDLNVVKHISEHVKTLNALKMSQVQLENALDLANLATWEFNVNTKQYLFNDCFYSMLGTTSEKEGGYSMVFEDYFRNYIHPEDFQLVMDKMKKSLKYQKSEFGTELEHRIIRADGKTRNMVIRVKIVNNNTKDDFYIYGTIQDITGRKKIEEELIESEEKFRELFNNANDSIFFHKLIDNKPGKFLEVNDLACQRLGYSRNELIKMGPQDIDKPGNIERIPIVMDNLIKERKTSFETEHITKNGELIPVEINAHLFTIRGEEYILSIVRDIRDRKKAEEALKNSEMKYRNIFENVQDIFYQTDSNGIIIEISPSIERYAGYRPEELIGKSVEMVYVHPEDSKDLRKEIAEKGEVVDYELKLKTKNDEVKYVSTNAHFLLDSNKNRIGVEGSLRDISERKNIEIQIHNSLIEKEMLLKEIHHRVKNNLTIISSLLNLQSRYITDKESREIFKQSQNRAKSMALIHEKLYQSTDLKKIDFGDYIQSLSSDLFHTNVVNPNLITLKLNVEEIFLDINTAIPLGLIVNELITNSLKHAFPTDMTGEININFHSKDNQYEFIMKDNGIGFPENINFANTDSLGLQIINSLTKQIDGNIELDQSNGTEFKITFKEVELQK